MIPLRPTPSGGIPDRPERKQTAYIQGGSNAGSFTWVADPLTSVGADWANLSAFQLLYALLVGAVAEALSRIRPAAQPNRYAAATRVSVHEEVR